MDYERISHPDVAAAYIESARYLYANAADLPMEFPAPPVVVKTASGAKVMVWLPAEEEDLIVDP